MALYNVKFDIITVATNTMGLKIIKTALKRAQEYRVILFNLQWTGRVY